MATRRKRVKKEKPEKEEKVDKKEEEAVEEEVVEEQPVLSFDEGVHHFMMPKPGYPGPEYPEYKEPEVVEPEVVEPAPMMFAGFEDSTKTSEPLVEVISTDAKLNIIAPSGSGKALDESKTEVDDQSELPFTEPFRLAPVTPAKYVILEDTVNPWAIGDVILCVQDFVSNGVKVVRGALYELVEWNPSRGEGVACKRRGEGPPLVSLPACLDHMVKIIKSAV